MKWQATSMTADQHVRLTIDPAPVRRQAEQRIQAMPLWIEKTRGTNAGDWLGGLAVVAVFAGMVFA